VTYLNVIHLALGTPKVKSRNAKVTAVLDGSNYQI
jgi:hypothetical protein